LYQIRKEERTAGTNYAHEGLPMLIRHTSYRSQSYQFRFIDWFYALLIGIGGVIFLLPVLGFMLWFVN
jgi:hypothetical protein